MTTQLDNTVYVIYYCNSTGFKSRVRKDFPTQEAAQKHIDGWAKLGFEYRDARIVSVDYK